LSSWIKNDEHILLNYDNIQHALTNQNPPNMPLMIIKTSKSQIRFKTNPSWVARDDRNEKKVDGKIEKNTSTWDERAMKLSVLWHVFLLLQWVRGCLSWSTGCSFSPFYFIHWRAMFSVWLTRCEISGYKVLVSSFSTLHYFLLLCF
jgi:hypothetical protein